MQPEPLPSKDEHYRFVFREQLQTDQDTTDFEEMLVSLPEPISLEFCLSCMRDNLTRFPNAMVGEVGLDRFARVPFDHRQERRKLTKFAVPFEHQIEVLEAQLRIAMELRRNVSIHSVRSQKATFDLLDRMAKEHGSSWFRISVDLHSCGLRPEMWKQIEVIVTIMLLVYGTAYCHIQKKHPNVFLSLSTVINGRSINHEELIKVADPTRLLVESDINQVGQCTNRTWDMLNIVANIRKWPIEEVWDAESNENEWGTVRRIKSNWDSFVRGYHQQK